MLAYVLLLLSLALVVLVLPILFRFTSFISSIFSFWDLWSANMLLFSSFELSTPTASACNGWRGMNERRRWLSGSVCYPLSIRYGMAFSPVRSRWRCLAVVLAQFCVLSSLNNVAHPLWSKNCYQVFKIMLCLPSTLICICTLYICLSWRTSFVILSRLKYYPKNFGVQ